MSKRKKVVVMTIPAEAIWEARKPRYNGYSAGHGPHGDTKYNRRKEKEKFEREEW